MANGRLARSRLTRGDNPVIGGVCAGVAEACGLEPVIVRIVFVAAVPLTACLACVAYVIMWKALPERPAEGGPVDVRPNTVLSETYGAMRYVGSKPRVRARRSACRTVSPAHKGAYVGVGHMPPEPPAAWSEALREAGAASAVQPGMRPTAQRRSGTASSHEQNGVETPRG